MKKLLTCILATLIAFTVAAGSALAQPRSQPPKPVAPPQLASAADIEGSVADGVYKNSFLGFELSLPTAWQALSSEEKNTAKSIGTDLLVEGTPSKQAQIEKAVNEELVVLSYAKKRLGAPENAALTVGVLKQPSAKVLPTMVLETTKAFFLGLGQFELLADTKVETIGGRSFAFMELKMKNSGQAVKIKYYVTMVKGYSLTFVFTQNDDADLKVLEDSLRTIRFTGQ